jgi:hypothetical protein
MESYLDILLYVITSKKLGVTVLYLKYNTVIPILIKEYLKLGIFEIVEQVILA